MDNPIIRDVVSMETRLQQKVLSKKDEIQEELDIKFQNYKSELEKLESEKLDKIEQEMENLRQEKGAELQELENKYASELETFIDLYERKRNDVKNYLTDLILRLEV